MNRDQSPISTEATQPIDRVGEACRGGHVKDLFVEAIPGGRRGQHRVEAVVESGFEVVVGEALLAQP